MDNEKKRSSSTINLKFPSKDTKEPQRIHSNATGKIQKTFPQKPNLRKKSVTPNLQVKGENVLYDQQYPTGTQVPVDIFHKNFKVERTNLQQTGKEFVNYLGKVQKDFKKLKSKPTGRQLVDSLNQGDFETVIRQQKQGKGSTSLVGTGGYRTEPVGGSKGEGVISGEINYDADKFSLKDKETPPYVALGHEMIHIYRGKKGMAVNRRSTVGNPKEEESRMLIDEYETVGLMTNELDSGQFTENMIRAEQNLPKRTTYGGKKADDQRISTIKSLANSSENQAFASISFRNQINRNRTLSQAPFRETVVEEND